MKRGCKNEAFAESAPELGTDFEVTEERKPLPPLESHGAFAVLVLTAASLVLLPNFASPEFGVRSLKCQLLRTKNKREGYCIGVAN